MTRCCAFDFCKDGDGGTARNWIDWDGEPCEFAGNTDNRDFFSFLEIGYLGCWKSGEKIAQTSVLATYLFMYK